MLASGSSWYNGSTDKSTIMQITFADIYSATGAETEEPWNADAEGTGSIKGYVTGTELIIAGNGMGAIMANPDSQNMFSGFSNLTSISNLNLIFTYKVTNMYSMFDGCSRLTSLDVSSFDTSNVTNMDSMFIVAQGKGFDQIKIGAKFSFSGNGSATCRIASTSGYWYTASGTQYTAATLPSNKAATYYSTKR